MAFAIPGRVERTAVPLSVAAAEAAALEAADVLARLGSGTGGLAADEAARRLQVAAPNAVRSTARAVQGEPGPRRVWRSAPGTGSRRS